MKKEIIAFFTMIVIASAALGYATGTVMCNCDKTITVNENVAQTFRNTLWETVSTAMDKKNDQRDIREVIFLTERVNHMKSNDYLQLKTGDIIIVPLQYEKRNSN